LRPDSGQGWALLQPVMPLETRQRAAMPQVTRPATLTRAMQPGWLP